MRPKECLVGAMVQGSGSDRNGARASQRGECLAGGVRSVWCMESGEAALPPW